MSNNPEYLLRSEQCELEIALAKWVDAIKRLHGCTLREASKGVLIVINAQLEHTEALIATKNAPPPDEPESP